MLDYYTNTIPIPDEDIDGLVAGLKEDGIIVTREEAERAILDLVELYTLICQPLPLPAPSKPKLLEG